MFFNQLVALVVFSYSLHVSVVEAISYHVEIKTGTVYLSGTDAQIYLTVFGSGGNTGPLKVESDSDMFESGDIDNFDIEAADVGKIEGIKIRHDNTGKGPGWYLSTVTISVPAHGMRYVFTPGRWVETDEAKVQMDKPSEAISYQVEIKTGTINKSGTDAKISLLIVGSRGNIGPFQLQSNFDSEPFEYGDINYINLKSYDIGKIEGIKIRHDNTGKGPGWYLSTVTISVSAHGMRYVITPGRWVETDIAKVQIDKVSSSEAISYQVEIKTGTINRSGTDAKVNLLIVGVRGNIGPFELEAKPDQLETADIDNFILQASDIGKIEGIKIIHDNTGINPDWYLSTVTISVSAHGMRYVFTPGRWVETDIAKVQIDKVSSSEDIDECQVNNGGCQEFCTNQIGSFTCSCNKDYELDTDRRQCKLCPSGWSLKFNKCYIFVDEQLTAQQAERKCSSLYSGIIAPTKNQEQLDFITSLSNGKDVFIGANDIRTEGMYYWSDGAKTSWTNWASGQPSNDVGDDCVVAKADKSWSSLQCKTIKYPVVCMANNNRCLCKDQVKTSTDGYFANSIVAVTSQAECDAKCSATTGCTHSMFFYGECELSFYLSSKPMNSADECKQFCTSTSGCQSFRHAGTTCKLYRKRFNRFVTDPNSSVLACLDDVNLPCL